MAKARGSSQTKQTGQKMKIYNTFAGNVCKNKHNPQAESLATTAEFFNKVTVQSGNRKAPPVCLWTVRSF